MQLNSPNTAQTSIITLNVWSPCIAWKISHWFSAGDSFSFKDVWGSFPTGILFSTRYYVLASWLTADQFQFSLTPWWTAINTVNSPEANYTIESYVWQVTFDVWYYTETFKAIIVSQWKDLAVFDWENISFPATVPFPIVKYWIFQWIYFHFFQQYSLYFPTDNPSKSGVFLWLHRNRRKTNHIWHKHSLIKIHS